MPDLAIADIGSRSTASIANPAGRSMAWRELAATDRVEAGIAAITTVGGVFVGVLEAVVYPSGSRSLIRCAAALDSATPLLGFDAR